MNHKTLFFCGVLAVILSVIFCPDSAFADTNTAAAHPTEYDAGPLPKAGLEGAKFRWWSPANTKIRGVLVLIPGRGGDGRGLVGDAAWQALATKTKFGIMGCFLANKKEDIGTYQHDPNGVVSELLNKAVNTLLAQNGQPIQNPPLAFWGHSAGSNVTECYASHHAERVVAAVLLRGPNGPGSSTAGKEAVPILIYIGKKDKPEWIADSLKNYEKGHTAHALWTLALNPNEGHEAGKTAALTAVFLEEAIKLRLPPPATGLTALTAATPIRLSKSDGWLGDTTSLEIGSYSTFKGKQREATWLLDEMTAKAWQAYLRGQ